MGRQLHVITDRVGVVRAALAAGARYIQVRAPKSTSDRQFYALATEIVALCRAVPGARCLINDRVGVALAVGADGFHLGPDDLPIPAARAVAPEAFIGASARDTLTARAAEEAGADYLGVGPVFATTSKPDLPAPIGLAGVAAVAAAVQIPVIAIGGITPDRVRDILAAGAAGVAAIGATAVNPSGATRDFLEALSPVGERV